MVHSEQGGGNAYGDPLLDRTFPDLLIIVLLLEAMRVAFPLSVTAVF